MSDRDAHESAERLLSRGQVVVASTLLAAIVAIGIFSGLHIFLLSATAVIITFYLVTIVLKICVSWAATGSRAPRYRVPRVDDPDLPKYTVLVPVYKEGNVIASLVKALSALNYPPAKLEVILLLERDDTDTLSVVNQLVLPANFRALVVSGSGPRTKPKACNIGYQHSSGDIIVIFDAEDRPDPDQLLRAVGAFRTFAEHDPRIACLQAQLAFWNPRQGWVSSFYWAEYVVHFQTVLAGLSRLGLIPPLGGTSNHFLTSCLDAVARANGPWEFEDEDGGTSIWGPWDPYNVTEDADLAFRLALAGYRIGMLDSKTYEEAPDSARKARNQRGRWLQGYMQTGLTHTRRPFLSIRRVGPLRYLAFIIFILGTPLSLMLNPLVWGITASYFAMRACGDPAGATFIRMLFPAPVYYTGMLVAVVGNLVLFFQKLVTPLRRQQETETMSSIGQQSHAKYLGMQEYGLSVRLLVTPLWWAFTSISAYRALRKLLIPSQRSHWDKTPHGHALETEAQIEFSSGNGGRFDKDAALDRSPNAYAAAGKSYGSSLAKVPESLAPESHPSQPGSGPEPCIPRQASSATVFVTPRTWGRASNSASRMAPQHSLMSDSRVTAYPVEGASQNLYRSRLEQTHEQADSQSPVSSYHYVGDLNGGKFASQTDGRAISVPEHWQIGEEEAQQKTTAYEGRHEAPMRSKGGSPQLPKNEPFYPDHAGVWHLG